MNQEGERYDHDQRDAEESASEEKFWEDIWSKLVDHNRDAKMLKELQSEVNVTKQEKVNIAKESLKKINGRMPNWKSPVQSINQSINKLINQSINQTMYF